ncbi:hypothetical protein VYU27_006166 [Nannochloropsis oceanica]
MAGVIVGCCWFTVGLKLFMNTLTVTSPSARPVIMAAEVKDKANRGVVLCAYDAKSLRLAWIQISTLRTLYGMVNESFIIYHADELRETIGAKLWRKQLKAIPGVQIQSLETWYQGTYASEFGTAPLQNFQGFFCKPAALLAAPFENVLMLDLDVIITDNPFVLMNTPDYSKQGAYLFADRRTQRPAKYMRSYRQQLRNISRHFNSPRNQTPFLEKLPPMTRWSYDYGESAVVLFNKTLNRDAMLVLEKILAPDLFNSTTKYIYGDKELYWQALVFAGVNVSLNPLIPSEVGTPNRNDEVTVTCTSHYVFAQWLWQPYATPKIFYVNGDGIEEMLMGRDQTILNCTLSDPLEYYSSLTQYNTFCNRGANPLPQNLIDTIWAYKIMYSKSSSKHLKV